MTAALYLLLTQLSTAAGLSFGSLQFRISEALTILPVFMPAAIPGLTVGCLLANLQSPFGLPDIAAGSLATLAAALLCRKFRDKKLFGLPLLSALMPVFTNAPAVALVLSLSSSAEEEARLLSFLLSCAKVAGGELLCAFIPGLLLYKLLRDSGFEAVLGKGKND